MALLIGAGLCIPLAIVVATSTQESSPVSGTPYEEPAEALERPPVSATAPRPISEVNEFVEATALTADASIDVRSGGSRLLTFKKPLAKPDGESPIVAIADPSVADIEVLPAGSVLRLIGLRAGDTELSVSTSDGDTYTFVVHAKHDLNIIHAAIQERFPTARISLKQLRQHVIINGQARNAAQRRTDRESPGIFDSSSFATLIQTLRRNSYTKILAEPNLVALNGHDATLLADGEFPIAVPQQNGVNTVEFRQFGVNLDFTPMAPTALQFHSDAIRSDRW